MKILVTGATGYIGAHLVKALYDLGHDVIGTDKHELNQIQKLTKNFFFWDIRKKNPTIAYYDKVVHLAAETKVHHSVLEPYKYYETNIIGTKNVINHSFKCGHFIYCSTGSAFQPESSPYASSKYAGELVTKQHHPLKHSIVRFYNVSGNDGYQKFDEVTHLIRRAAKVANNIRYQMNDSGYNHMEVYGIDYDTRDGTTIRNYTHIKDIVNGLVNIVQNDPTNKIECLGSERGFTVREVIDTMKKVSGVDFEVRDMDRRTGDLPVSVIPKASQYFEEKYTLEDMCKDALEHEKLLEGIE